MNESGNWKQHKALHMCAQEQLMCWQVPLKDNFQGGLQGLDFVISFSASFQRWEEVLILPQERYSMPGSMLWQRHEARILNEIFGNAQSVPWWSRGCTRQLCCWDTNPCWSSWGGRQSAKSLSRSLGVIFIALAGNARAHSCRKLLLQYFTKASFHTFYWLEGAEVLPSDEWKCLSSLL